MTPSHDSTLWGMIASGLAAVGGAIAYYFKHRAQTKNREWWINAAADVIASVFIGIVVFLVASPFTGDTVAAGLAGLSGHIGTRGVVRLIHQYIFRKTR